MGTSSRHRRWILILLACNVVTLGLLIALGSRYRVGAKAWQRLFHEGRAPLLQPEYRNNRKYEASQEIFRLYPVQPVEGIVLGDSQVAGVSWPELMAPAKVVGRGIDGDTAEGLLARLEDLAVSDPRWLAVMIGTNDVLNGRNSTEIAESIIDYCKRMIAQHPDTLILLVSIPPMANWVERAERRNEIIEEINRRLRDHCSGKAGLRWIPLSERIRDPSGHLARSMTTDGIHLGADAYAKLRDLIRGATKDLPSIR
jgi:lysophospholipase L1-like esterase